MVGEGQLKEQAKHQWDRLDAEGHRIINEILTATPKKVEWPEDTEPKFTKKRITRAIRSVYNTKTKRYTYYDNNIVAPGDPIRLELADSFFHFCYHPERKEHIKIDTSARLEADAEYIVTVSNCHWIHERNVTVVTLLAYATQRAQVARNNLKQSLKKHPQRKQKSQNTNATST